MSKTEDKLNAIYAYVKEYIEQNGYAPAVQRYLYRTPMAAWTVRDEAQLALAKKRGDMVIFENIDPAGSAG